MITPGRAVVTVSCSLLFGLLVPLGAFGVAPTSVASLVAPSAAAEYLPGTAPIDATPSLPSVKDGARPGPDVLYSPEPTSPQLSNHDPRFRAQPLLVSGTEGYDSGEYLYQDYLYDDHGSEAMPVSATDQTVDANAQVSTPDGTVDPNALNYNVGTITYPTNPVYAGNAADLVEFRVAVGPDSDAYRFTLNTLLRADTSIMSLAFDLDHNAATGTSILPRDPGAPFPGTDAVLTTWGTGGEVSTFGATGGLIATVPVEVAADLASAQITVTVPHAVLHPTGIVRATLATGLFDSATGGWLKPGITATDSTPGGAGSSDPTPSGIFNLGFRMDENVQRLNTPPDEEQAADLAAHDPTAEAHDIDFGALYAGVVRDTVPATGLQIRMYASRQNLGVGESTANPQYLSQLQPYSVFIPSSGALSHPHQLQLYMHSNGENYWQFDGSQIFNQLGEGNDAVVLSPAGRARSGYYIGYSEYDVFEAWNDLAHHVLLNPDEAALGGYSMGGYGTYRLGGLYPDLFGKAFSAMGPPGQQIWIPGSAPIPNGYSTLTNMWLENNRNLPYLDYAEAADELVPQAGPLTQNVGTPVPGTESFQALGYRYTYAVFTGGEHYTLAVLGYNFPMGQAFVRNAVVDRDPTHVTYAQVPSAGDPVLGLNHDHAYWVSGIVTADRSAGDRAKGVVDARSEGFGVGDPMAEPLAPTEGIENIPYTEVGQTWSAAPARTVKNRVDIIMTNLLAAALQLDRAKLSSTASDLTLAVTADRAATLTLSDASADTSVTGTLDGKAQPGLRIAGGKIVLPIVAGAHTYILKAVSPVAARTAASAVKRKAANQAAAKNAARERAAARKAAANRAGTTQPSGTLAYTGMPADLPLLALGLGLAGVFAAALRRRHRTDRRTGS